MSELPRDHDAVTPNPRVNREGTEPGYFYAGEVSRILGLDDIDYQQLRNLFRFVREQAGQSVPKGWARYTLTDLAGIEAALRLTRGVDSARPSRHYRLKPLRAACGALRSQGFSNPLLEVPMRRDGDRVFALIGTTVIEPATGQLVMERASNLVHEYLKSTSVSDVDLLSLLRLEQKDAPKKPQKLIPRDDTSFEVL
jgi:hypothetical protein